MRETEGQCSNTNMLSFIIPLGIYLQDYMYTNWKHWCKVTLNNGGVQLHEAKYLKQNGGGKTTRAHKHVHTYQKNQKHSLPLKATSLKNVCTLLSSIILPWHLFSSLSVERGHHTSELRAMASTSALKTLRGRRSRVVPLSTIALSVLYWKRVGNRDVEIT